MRRLVPLGLLCALATGLLGCGANEPAAPDVPVGPVKPGRAVETVGDVRFSLPTTHRVVAERRTADGWGDPRVVFEDQGRECGRVHAIAAGSTVAAILECDEHYSDDQAPTASVALISADARTWTHRDLEGEAYASPGLSPLGGHAVWVQDDDLLTWEAGSFSTAPDPTGSAPQVLTVDDSGTILAVRVGISAGQCELEVRTYAAEVSKAVVPIAGSGQGPDELQCVEIGLSFATPSEIHGDVSFLPGSDFVLRRTSAGGYVLTTPPPIAAPGLDVYSDDSARAIWNEVIPNTRGDLVAVGSPDRQHITAQRYDPSRHRWSPSRVVYDAGAPVCRRTNGEAGAMQGATFRLRLMCAGQPIVLRSRTGETWSR